jgi:hypothetical protein
MKETPSGHVTGLACPIGHAYCCFTRVGSRINVNTIKTALSLLPTDIKV